MGRFFTNLDGPVFAIVNLPEVVKGALFARYSRSPKSVRRLFLDEFYHAPEAGIATLADEIDDTDPSIGVKRAEDLYERVFSQYGDDSVAQLGGAHLAVEQPSNLLTKILEWGRLGAYLEQSTRYIFYDQKLGDRYRYTVPHEMAASGLHDEYVDLMDWLFDTYSSLVTRLVPYYETLYPRQEGDSKFIWRSTIRAKACDDLRGPPPRLNPVPRRHLRHRPVLRDDADADAGPPAGGGPSLCRPHAERAAQSHPGVHEASRRPRARRRLGQLPARYRRSHGRAGARLDAAPEPRGEVTLVDWDPEAELKTAAAALYPYTSLPDDQILAAVRTLSEAERVELIRSYAGNRANRRHKPGRGMERSDYRFDILCDYGIFRDLQRHRMLTIDWQRLSPLHGYVTPESISDIGAVPTWDEAMARTADLHSRISDRLGPDVAQYAVPFAYKIRFFFQLNAREAFHLIELRTGEGGHPDYRRICQLMHREIRDRAGHRVLSDAMTYVDHEDYDLARLEGERRAAAKRAALGIEDPE